MAATFAGHLLTGVRTIDAEQTPALRAKLAQGLRRVDVPQDAAGRTAFIAKWVQRHQRRLAAGLPASVLVLAMGSAAAAQDGLTDLSTVEGVAEVELRADGSVMVTLDNGSTVVLPQQSVSVGADGTILISASAMDSLTAIIANAGADVGVVGGGLAVAGLGLAMGGGSGGGAVTGGGGGGSGGGDTGGGGGGVAPIVSSNGRVIDGYIANATVFRDLNANGILDAGEPNVATDATGNFAGLEGTGGVIVAFGGTDISTGKAFTGQLTAPGDAAVVTPLTTLVQALVQQGGGSVTAEQAAQQVAQAFGLRDFDINNDDPVGTDNLEALKAGAQVAAIISVAAAGAAEGGEAAASEAVAQSLATAIANRNVEAGSDLLTPEAITDALQAAAGDDADVGEKAAALNTAVQAIEIAQDVAGVETVQTAVQGVLVDSVKEGEVLTEGALSEAIVNAVPLRPLVNFNNLPEVVNASFGESLSISLGGTGRTDTTITLSFGGETLTTLVESSGFWSFDQTVMTPPDGEVTFLLSASEETNGTTVVSQVVTVGTMLIDTDIPSTPTIALAEDTGSVAGETRNGTITVSGLEDGTTREYAVNGSEWTAFEGNSFLLAVEGDYTVIVRQTDSAGNVSAPSQALEFTLDTTAPGTPTLFGFEPGEVINAEMAQEGVTVTGTVEPGATVTLASGNTIFTVTDGAGDDSLDGSYSITLSEDELPEDGDYTISITATDGAGNVSDPFEIDITVDTTRPAAPTIALAEDTGLVAGFTRNSEIIVSGLEDGARAEFSNNGGEWFPIAGNSFTLPWGDGFYPIVVRQIDAAGNVSPDSAPLFFTLDTVAPVVWGVDPIGNEGVINAAAAAEGVTISGSLNGGSRVTLTLGEASFTFDDTDGDDSLEGFSFEISADELPDDGEYTVNITVTDGAGNVGSQSFGPVTIDTAAPSAPMIATVPHSDQIDFDEPSFVVSGTAEEGTTVRVTVGDVTEETTATGGAFSVTFTTSDFDGSYTINATATDAAGNTSEAGSRDIFVFPAPDDTADAMALIGSAMTLAEMEAALTAFAAAQEELTIPEGMLSDLAGDALLYRGGQYSFAFSGTVLDVEGAPEGVALNSTFGGVINFGLPLGDSDYSIDQLAEATDPVAVFQFQQDEISGNALEGLSLDNLRLLQPSLRMEIETLEDLPPDEFLDALVTPAGREQLVEGETITNLQIWLSGVTAGTQDTVTGEFSGLNGSEISLHFIRVGEVGLESFFDDPAGNILREISIETYLNGNETGSATAKVDTLTVTFTPGGSYNAEELVAGFKAVIDLRLAIETAIEKANAGELSVDDIRAIANELESEFIPFAPPFLAGEALSQAAVNRIGAFLMMDTGEQTSLLESFNISGFTGSNLTDLLAIPALFPIATEGGNTGGETGVPTIVEFIPGEDGPDATEIYLNGETVNLLALVETAIGMPNPSLGIEIIGVDNRPGIVLEDGRVAIKLFVEVPTSPTGEDWLLFLTPEGAVDAYYRGGFNAGEPGLLTFDDVYGDAQGIVFSVINASVTGDVLTQGNAPYFTTYRLSLGDLRSLADTEGLTGGRLELYDLIDNAETLLMVNGLTIPFRDENEFVLPIAYGIEVDSFGNPEAYVIAGVGTLDFTLPDNAFVVNRTVFYDRNGKATELPGAITELTPVMNGGEVSGIKIAMTLALEPAGVGATTQYTVFFI